MKWILASTTALALTMGVAQFSVAQEATPPAATDDSATPTQGTETDQGNDTLLENQPVTPQTGTEATDTAPAADPDATVTMEGDLTMPTDAMSARKIVGADVIGPDGNAIGAVDDLVLDASGKIEQVIIADGAILGFGGKNVVISYEGAMLTQEADGADPVLRVSMTEEALEGAAEFDKSQLEQQGDRLASSYIDRDVKLAASDSTGEINDLLLDQSGTVKFAVIAFGGVLGLGEDEVAVGFDKISPAPEGEPMQIAVSEEELQSAPKFEPEPMADPAMNQPVTPAPEPVAPAN